MLESIHQDAILDGMRTTVTLADDVAAVVDRLRRERSIGVSEAVNELIRNGLVGRGGAKPRIEFPTHDMGMRIDVRDIGEAIEAVEALDEPMAP